MERPAEHNEQLPSPELGDQVQDRCPECGHELDLAPPAEVDQAGALRSGVQGLGAAAVGLEMARKEEHPTGWDLDPIELAKVRKAQRLKRAKPIVKEKATRVVGPRVLVSPGSSSAG
jgi:hypothetical protein